MTPTERDRTARPSGPASAVSAVLVVLVVVLAGCSSASDQADTAGLHGANEDAGASDVAQLPRCGARPAGRGAGRRRGACRGLGAGGGSQPTPWLGAWTPGTGESVLRDGYGVPLAAGSQLIMQVHYSLLAGEGVDDVTAAELRVTDGAADLAPVSTLLLPAPVELPCRPEHAHERLCDRSAALDDVQERFGDGAGGMVDWLRRRCAGDAPGRNRDLCSPAARPSRSRERSSGWPVICICWAERSASS